jgi:hypothetical protein
MRFTVGIFALETKAPPQPSRPINTRCLAGTKSGGTFPVCDTGFVFAQPDVRKIARAVKKNKIKTSFIFIIIYIFY